MATHKYFIKNLSNSPVSFTEARLLASVPFKVMQATSAAKVAGLFYTGLWFNRWDTIWAMVFPCINQYHRIIKKHLENLILLSLLLFSLCLVKQMKN